MRDAPDPPSEESELSALVALLGTTWFAAGLSPEALLSLARLARRYQVPAGTTLLAEGQPVRELGIVLSGRVSVRTLVPERGMVTILTVEPGDIFAKSALVPPYRSTASVVAIQALDAIALDGPPPARRPGRGLRPRRGALSAPGAGHLAPPRRHPPAAARPLRGRAGRGVGRRRQDRSGALASGRAQRRGSGPDRTRTTPRA